MPGFAATRPEWGDKIDPADERVQSYVRHLRSRHDAVLRDVGAGGGMVYSYSYSFSRPQA